MIARVLIRNKRGVFNPEGKVVEGGLHRLGYEVQRVRVGKVVELDLATDDREAATAVIAEMCAKFLVNPVIEDYEIEFDA